MLISIAEYAEMHGVKRDTIKHKILRGALPAQKIGRNWCIDSDTPYTDLRVKSGNYKNWRKSTKEKEG